MYKVDRVACLGCWLSECSARLPLLYISILYGKCTEELGEVRMRVDAAGSFGVPNKPAAAFERVDDLGTRLSSVAGRERYQEGFLSWTFHFLLRQFMYDV